jgi:hypothetical protein
MHPIYGTGQGRGISPMIWCFCPVSYSHVTTLMPLKHLFPDRTGALTFGMIDFIDDGRKCQLTHLEVWTYYYACYLPSIGYPLSCSSLSRKQLDSIQLRAMSITVAICGYNRSTKKEILYGPMDYGGASFRPLYFQQGEGQIMSFLRHWRQRSLTGGLLRCAVASWTQMTAGISYSILQNVNAILPHLESKWLASMRTFMASIDATMILDNPAIPPCNENMNFISWTRSLPPGSSPQHKCVASTIADCSSRP